jgi:hypothetical protein
MPILFALLLHILPTPAVKYASFWFECHQIGDNLYSCNGGRL